MTDQRLPAEAQALALIDAQLRRAGWHVCDRNDIDLVNHQGVAVREVIVAPGHGRVDYLLRRPACCRVIEANDNPRLATLHEVIADEVWGTETGEEADDRDLD